MSEKKLSRPRGWYCKVCGKYKPNEKFSGKGHVVHICKICSRLSAAEQAKATTLTRLENLTARRLNATDKKWLENRVRDRRPEVAEMAKKIYRARFPYAERNARKKQIAIRRLSFEIHAEIFDENGDELPVNRRFTVERASRILTMKDFDRHGEEIAVMPDNKELKKLLRWAIHNLEIFMWAEDYDADTDENPAPGYGWRVQIEYTDGTFQNIASFQDYLDDRPEELYFALLEYFEPQKQEKAPDE